MRLSKTYNFSFDDEDDALKSLMEYYEIDNDVIDKNLSEINRLVKEKEDIGSNDIGMYTHCIRMLLTPKVEKSINKIRVSYYHRCGSDGTLEWFKEGLLNSEDGLKNLFIKRIY